MARRAFRPLAPAIAAWFACASPAGADAGFRIEPNAMAPAGPPGQVRRFVQPFGGWTLVCDEDVKARRRVCNVAQVFVDAEGRPAFNWSLAATRSGAPVIILRAPNRGGPREVQIAFGKEPPNPYTLSACDERTCLGFLPVTAALQRRIREGATAEINLIHEGRFRTLDAPLKDLATALASVK